MKYLKYRWDENRGDEHADWGASWWYFEVAEDGWATRQIEVYDSGARLRYGAENPEDQFGGLSFGNESEMDRPADEVLSASDFEREWETGPWHNEHER